MQAQTKYEFVLNLKIAKPRLEFPSSLLPAPTAIESGLLTSDYGTKPTCQPARRMSALRGRAEIGVGKFDFRV
jgi:hypothetical protein